MAYETNGNPSVVIPNNGILGNDAMGFILGMVFGNRGFGFGGNGDAASVATNNATFEGIRDQVNQISQQLNANQAAAQSAAVQSRSRMVHGS